VLLTAVLLFALFYTGSCAPTLTTVLVLAFTLIPVAGVQEQALVGVLCRFGRRRALRRRGECGVERPLP
jgi:hypothetical protein